jgi:hypothetical protein
MSPVVLSPILSLARRAERRLDRWSIESQLRARRNAMVASTQLAQRRAEREDVDDFFAALLAAPVAATSEVRAAR